LEETIQANGCELESADQPGNQRQRRGDSKADPQRVAGRMR
jgi:hypothetical protein